MDKNLQGKRLLILGGSTWKDAIRGYADENGICLIAAAPYKVGIFDIADECFIADVTNLDEMKEFIREHRIDGIYMGGSEPVIEAACQYINDLGFPCYCTKEQWEVLQNKAKFKELCIVHGLPVVPQFALNPKDIAHSVPDEAYPVITKPTDGCGSKGFSVCRNPDELEMGYKRATSASPTGSVICEKFVNNESVGFFATFSEGKTFFSGLEDKIPVRYDGERSYVGGIFLFESNLVQDFKQRFMDKIESLFADIGIREGNAWIEVFYDNGQYYFNEVGFRYGGSVSIYPVDYFYNINQVASDICFALTGKSCIFGHKSLIPSNIKRKQHYCAYPIHAQAGTITKIVGVEELEKRPEIVIVNVNKNVGDTIMQTGSFSQVIALVHFVFDELDECKATIRQIHDTLLVSDSEGNNLIVRKLDESNVRFLSSTTVTGTTEV